MFFLTLASRGRYLKISGDLRSQCDRKKSLNVYKVAQNDFSGNLIDFGYFTKIALECERLLLKALKSAPKSNKSPNLVTLSVDLMIWAEQGAAFTPKIYSFCESMYESSIDHSLLSASQLLPF